jgi:glycosidase
MGNISGNQDKPRFISYADGSLPFDLPGNEYKRIGWKNDIEVADSLAYQKLLMLHLFNLTIPGIPIIYYGDEIGIAGAGDPDNRRMMRFEGLKSPESQLLEKLKELIKMREKSMALNYGDFKILEVSPTIFKYQRTYFKEVVIITFNKKNWNYQIQQINEN